MIQKLTDLVIKPYRPSYDPKVDLGPTTFSIDNKYLGARIDFKISNRRNQTLECSLFRRTVEKNKKYPLIVFCHGNTGNRTNSYGAVYSMLRAKVNVLTFDFAGCGLSGGKTISLGFYEQDDIADVLDYIVTKYSFVDMNRIGLWGRCMGAVSSLLLASRNDYISLLVLDTPFADFPAMLRDYIQRVKIIPKWAENYIYDNLRTKIKEQANFDIEDVVPVNHVAKCKIPAILVHGTKDGIVPPHSFKRVYDAYPGPKEYIELETSHNDARPDFVYQKIANFVQAEFFSKSQSRTRGDSNAKKMNPSLNTEPFTQPKFVSLDSIRFNESMFDFQGKEALDPVQKAFDDLRSEKTNEFSDFWDTTNGIYEQITSIPYYKDTKGKIRSKMTSTQSVEKKKFTFPQVDEDDEADISEEMSCDGDTINHDILKFGNTKRFLHNLQNQPH